MKTRTFWFRWAAAGGLCLALGACGGEDSGSEPSNNNNNDNDNGSENEGNDNDFDSTQPHSNQNSNQQTQESECSSSSECDFVVCDCFDGPVNFQGCRVVNDVGICATESTCDSDFNACE